MKIYKLGDKITNPETGRYIEVGKPAWRKLAKKGLVSSKYRNPKVKANIKDDSEAVVQQKKKKLQEELQDTSYQIVRGKKSTKNNLVLRKRLNKDKFNRSKNTNLAKKVSSILLNNIDILTESNNIEKDIEQTLMRGLNKEEQCESESESESGSGSGTDEEDICKYE